MADTKRFGTRGGHVRGNKSGRTGRRGAEAQPDGDRGHGGGETGGEDSGAEVAGGRGGAPDGQQPRRRPGSSAPPHAVIPVGPVIERNRFSMNARTVMDMNPLPRRDVEESRKTVMMQAPGLVAHAEPAGGASHLAEVHAPPQIDVVRHELPDDAPADPRLTLLIDPDSQRSAAFRVLRHHLLEEGRPKVVAVSSARDRAGKTTCAVNLAMALAECGRARVLLVDGNLRRPEIAGLFRFVPPWCFAEQLAVHREQPLLPWGVVEIPALCLHVAAINPRRDPGRLLDAPAFAIAMERLRLGPYDHIVIDCPSVLGGADVNLIQDSADGVLLVARRARSTARDLTQAVEQLSPTKVLGTALLE